MDQLNSIFSRLKRGLYVGGGDTRQPPEKQQALRNSCSTDHGTADDEEGFVLLGDNDDTETTVFISENKANDQGADRQGAAFTMFATCDQLTTDCASAEDPHDHGQGITFHPAIIGVPFQINPKLRAKERLQNIFCQLDLETSRFDWHKYTYDFTFEQSSLRELGAVEDRMMRTNS